MNRSGIVPVIVALAIVMSIGFGMFVSNVTRKFEVRQKEDYAKNQDVQIAE